MAAYPPSTRVRPNPLVFLSSALKGGPQVPAGIYSERERIFRHGETYGPNAVWVDEIIEPGRGADPFAAIDDFLFELERSRLYLALFATDWPGSGVPVSGKTANATFFETELFYAAVLGRPIAVVIRTDITIPPDTAYLLELLRRVLPRISWHEVGTARDAEETTKRLIDKAALNDVGEMHRRHGEFGQILHHWWKWREPDANAPGLRWLDGRFVQPQQSPNEVIVEECLAQVEQVASERQRLYRLWIAARELMAVPYDQTTEEYWLSCWNRMLTEWNKAAAWYGLHGHLELGYMSALYSLDDIRTRGRHLNPKLVDDPSWDPPYSSLGSAYYAAAHRVDSSRYRRLGLQKALAFVDRTSHRDSLARSNALAIRGSILQKLHAYSASVETYREVLQLRQSTNASPGSIGEAMSELGFGLLFTLNLRQGRDLLREGVELMQRSSYRAGFIVRAKRKLAVALMLTGRFKEAREQRAEARELAMISAVGRVS